ncbi:MAG: response regulator SirA [Elusimicrobia bacterium CG_4_10_14_0_8_um_filter_37_32]|nr:MAG: response regulator SirA [Elusimicrobia bacterium CG_4_10_14_0_8_um_filter_37_32]
MWVQLPPCPLSLNTFQMIEQPSLFPEKEIAGYKIKNIIKRDGRIVPFDKERVVNSIFRSALSVGGSNRQIAEKLTDKVIKIINQTHPVESTPSVEEIQDIVERVLVENFHFKTAKAYILYREEHRRIREGKDSRIIVEDNVPYKILWKVFTWNIDHHCDTIEKINRLIAKKKLPQLVIEAEKTYQNEINRVAKEIIKNRDRTRIAIAAGPSSSGKTTTITKISEILRKENISFILLNLDNYFKNLESHPKDEYGDYDFETPQALDIQLINEHLTELINGKTITMPEYNFKTGKRNLNAKKLKLNPSQIILIDSLHGLYDKITSAIPDTAKYKLYVESLCQTRDENGEFVRWADLRMLRRMSRDSWHRGYDPLHTVGHWHYVRRSEMKFIVPFISKVDCILNTAMPYELPIHKKYLFKYFPKIIKTYENDPRKLDAYIRAKRVYELLKSVTEVKNDSIVPENSLLREFIGGSCYKY